MKNNRKTTFIVLLLGMLLLLSACGAGNASLSGGSSGSGGSGSSSSSINPPSAYPGSGGYADYPQDAGYGAADNMASMENALPDDRKVIRNASLDITAKDAAGLYKSIVDFGTGLGGYENSYSISNFETYSMIRAEFKIPPEQLSAFVSFIGDMGTIVNSSMASEDITENYFDATTRLETKRKSLERYYELLKDARGIEEIVYIQRTIDSITEDIESLEGRLRVWNSLVNMATVNLYIRQNNDPTQIRKEITWNTLSMDDMAYLIKRGFYSVTNSIMSTLQWIVVGIIGYSPLWILLIIGIILWLRFRSGSRNKGFKWPSARPGKKQEDMPDNDKL